MKYSLMADAIRAEDANVKNFDSIHDSTQFLFSHQIVIRFRLITAEWLNECRIGVRLSVCAQRRASNKNSDASTTNGIVDGQSIEPANPTKTRLNDGVRTWLCPRYHDCYRLADACTRPHFHYLFGFRCCSIVTHSVIHQSTSMSGCATNDSYRSHQMSHTLQYASNRHSICSSDRPMCYHRLERQGFYLPNDFIVCANLGFLCFLFFLVQSSSLAHLASSK